VSVELRGQQLCFFLIWMNTGSWESLGLHLSVSHMAGLEFGRAAQFDLGPPPQKQGAEMLRVEGILVFEDAYFTSAWM
jgi:hypothetical protein